MATTKTHPSRQPAAAGPRTPAEKLKRHDSFLQLLQLVAVAANGAPTALDKALQATLDEVCKRTGWTLGHVLLGDPAGEVLIATDLWHAKDGYSDDALHSFDTMSERVFKTGKSECVPDVRADSQERATTTQRKRGEPVIVAAAAFPIVVGERAVGVLQFFSPHPFEADAVVQDVMVQVGLVLGRILERVWYEDSLRDARAKAEAASDAKSEFLSHMSHELRTPLTAILGYAELLQFETMPDKQRTQLLAIEQAGEHLLNLVNDVLHVSSSSQLANPVAHVSVEGVVRDACILLQPLARSQNVTLRQQAPAATETLVLAARQALMQIVMNLLANGIKYNRDGGEVLVSTREQENERVSIEVADTGHGISDDDLKRIFLPFERLAGARTRDGTGLGLGIARDLAEKMGGVLEARSTVGSGSTFSVTLPSAPRSSTAATPDSPDVTETTTGPPRVPAGDEIASRPKVLFVEDNLANIDVVQEMFSSRRPDIELITTIRGTLALDLARAHLPQLILLDIHLPDLDGIEVLEQLRNEITTRHIPIAALSADVTSSSMERMMGAGAVAYLTKPIRIRTLLDLLEETVGKRDDDAGESVPGKSLESRQTLRL